MKTSLVRPLGAAAFALAAGLAWTAATAAVVTLTPSSVATSSGTPVAVDVRVSNLGTGNALGAFDLDVSYNPALLSFGTAVFGTSLGNPASFEALTNASASTPGIVDFGEVSLLAPAQLAAGQAGSFLLATLNFNGTASGTNAFALLGTSVLSDAFGRPLTIVQVTPIPEPETFSLLGLGLAALAVWRRRASRGRAGVPH